MEITGEIIVVLPIKSGVSKSTGKEWESQEYVIETSDQYPKKMCFTVFGSDKIEQFNLQKGDRATVYFNVDAKQWQDRWFNSITAWKVDSVVEKTNTAQAPSYQQQAPTQQRFDTTEKNGDLPF